MRKVLENPLASGHPAIAYKQVVSTIRTQTHRLILHDDGYTELYDHTTVEKETKNVVYKQPEVVEALKVALTSKMH